MQFESNGSYLRQCNLQNHKMQLMVTESGATLEADEEPAYFSDDSEVEGKDVFHSSLPISPTNRYSYEDTS